jgi:hypothetical protein
MMSVVLKRSTRICYPLLAGTIVSQFTRAAVWPDCGTDVVLGTDALEEETEWSH